MSDDDNMPRVRPQFVHLSEVAVDSITQTLADSVSTANALNALITAADSSPVIAGKFKIDS